MIDEARLFSLLEEIVDHLKEIKESIDYPIGVTLFRDGNAWCAVRANFVNLQESHAGFGDTRKEALADLVRQETVATR